jgi:hypothetical protein
MTRTIVSWICMTFWLIAAAGCAVAKGGKAPVHEAPASYGEAEMAPMDATAHEEGDSQAVTIADTGTRGALAMDIAGAPQAKQEPDAHKPKPAPAAKKGGQAQQQGAPGQQQGAGADSKTSPILIYTADFTMSVFEVARSLDAVEGLAKAAGGYLARRDDASITVRVPAEKFSDAVVAIEKIGDVLSRNVVSEDVTAEYRDLEVQLANLLALRNRFEKLLEKAQKVEEALQIEKELGRITGEIERIKGRLKLLTDLATYSTITVSFRPRVAQQVQEGPFVLPLPWLNNLGLRHLLSL